MEFNRDEVVQYILRGRIKAWKIGTKKWTFVPKSPKVDREMYIRPGSRIDIERTTDVLPSSANAIKTLLSPPNFRRSDEKHTINEESWECDREHNI